MSETIFKLLDNASEMYYKGTPIMSDEEFDKLAFHFKYDRVGHQITNGIPHYYRMYSLKKCFDLADAPIPLNECVRTPKLDGAAISILYVNNNLTLALTRGDGKVGQDITEKIKLLVPNKIELGGIIQITGEILAPNNISNARNYAAGALNLKDLEEFKTRDLTFVAYDILPYDIRFDTWSFAMHYLHLDEGFMVVTYAHHCRKKFPTDGEVYRIDNINAYNSLGFTATHPRGAFALKEKKEGVITKLLDVVWQVGKSGVVSPVAILEPVLVGDATVSRATLHNMKYIEELNLELGCNVEVLRSGEIIPRVVRRVE